MIQNLFFQDFHCPDSLPTYTALSADHQKSQISYCIVLLSHDCTNSNPNDFELLLHWSRHRYRYVRYLLY